MRTGSWPLEQPRPGGAKTVGPLDAVRSRARFSRRHLHQPERLPGLKPGPTRKGEEDGRYVRLAGLDVSKDKLDVYAAPSGESRTVGYDRRGLAGLRRWLVGLGVAMVAVEPSGGYEREVSEVLEEAGLIVHRLNPLRVRRFAQLKGRLAKTDRLDARTIAQSPAPGRRSTSSGAIPGASVWPNIRRAAPHPGCHPRLHQPARAPARQPAAPPGDGPQSLDGAGACQARSLPGRADCRAPTIRRPAKFCAACPRSARFSPPPSSPSSPNSDPTRRQVAALVGVAPFIAALYLQIVQKHPGRGAALARMP